MLNTPIESATDVTAALGATTAPMSALIAAAQTLVDLDVSATALNAAVNATSTIRTANGIYSLLLRDAQALPAQIGQLATSLAAFFGSPAPSALQTAATGPTAGTIDFVPGDATLTHEVRTRLQGGAGAWSVNTLPAGTTHLVLSGGLASAAYDVLVYAIKDGVYSSPALAGTLQLTSVVQTLDHLTLTISAASVGQTGTPPTLTLSAWADSAGTIPFTGPFTPAPSYSASAPSVATVNASTGAIILQGPGTDVFTVAAGGKSATTSLTVTASPPANVPTIASITPSTIQQGATQDLVLAGSNFDANCTVLVDGTGVTFNTIAAVAGVPTSGPNDSGTNAIVSPRDYSNAAWTHTRTTYTPSAAAGPSGVAGGATKIVEDTSSSTHNLTQTIAVTSGQSQALEIELCAAQRTWARIGAYEGSTYNEFYLNLTAGAIYVSSTAQTTDALPAVVSLGGGWWKIKWIHVPVGASSTLYLGPATGLNGASYAGDGTSGILIGGVQWERNVSAPTFDMFPGSPAVAARPSLDSPNQITVNATAAPGLPSGTRNIKVHSTTNGDSGTVPLTLQGINSITLEHYVGLGIAGNPGDTNFFCYNYNASSYRRPALLTPKDQTGTFQPASLFNFASSDASVATVDATGQITFQANPSDNHPALVSATLIANPAVTTSLKCWCVSATPTPVAEPANTRVHLPAGHEFRRNLTNERISPNDAQYKTYNGGRQLWGTQPIALDMGCGGGLFVAEHLGNGTAIGAATHPQGYPLFVFATPSDPGITWVQLTPIYGDAGLYPSPVSGWFEANDVTNTDHHLTVYVVSTDTMYELYYWPSGLPTLPLSQSGLVSCAIYPNYGSRFSVPIDECFVGNDGISSQSGLPYGALLSSFDELTSTAPIDHMTGVSIDNPSRQYFWPAIEYGPSDTIPLASGTITVNAGAASMTASPGAGLLNGQTIIINGKYYTVSAYTSGGTSCTLAPPDTISASSFVIPNYPGIGLRMRAQSNAAIETAHGWAAGHIASTWHPFAQKILASWQTFGIMTMDRDQLHNNEVPMIGDPRIDGNAFTVLNNLVTNDFVIIDETIEFCATPIIGNVVRATDTTITGTIYLGASATGYVLNIDGVDQAEITTGLTTYYDGNSSGLGMLKGHKAHFSVTVASGSGQHTVKAYGVGTPRWNAAGTAQDVTNNSQYSDPFVAKPAQTLTGISAASFQRGTSGTETFTGTGFRSSSVPVFTPATGLTLSNITIVNGGTITATLVVDAAAPLGAVGCVIHDTGGIATDSNSISKNITNQFAPFDVGINFRATAAFVTDGPNETYCIGDTYPVTRGGAMFGWKTPLVNLETRDRSSSGDRRLAGINRTIDDGTSGNTFQLDGLVPGGVYQVHLGFHDTQAEGGLVKTYDGATLLGSYDWRGGYLFSANAYDATPGIRPVGYSVANWPTSEQPQQYTIAGSSLTIQFAGSGATGDSSGDHSLISHVRVVRVG